MFSEKKTIASFRLLPFLLPTPPKRGVKRPRRSPKAVADLMFVDIEVCIYLFFLYFLYFISIK